jgi:hypothetical protein
MDGMATADRPPSPISGLRRLAYPAQTPFEAAHSLRPSLGRRGEVTPVREGRGFSCRSDADGSGTRAQGVVLCDQTRTVDARARTFRRIERAPAQVVQEALDAVRSILE